MKLLMNPTVLRMSLLLLIAVAAFVVGAIVIRRVRRKLVEETQSISEPRQAPQGLPVHAYSAVIQQLKQQKHELTARELAERRKAKASDSLSAAVLSNLTCGVLFFNPGGLVRQANPAARKLLGYASPIGMRLADLFGNARIRPADAHAFGDCRVDEALSPALSGEVVVRGLGVDYIAPDGRQRVFEVTLSPVLGEDATLMGSTCLLTDRTEVALIEQDRQMEREISAEMALGLRNSLASIAGYAQQLAKSRDPELARQLADDIASEAAQLDRTIGSFLAGAKSASPILS